VSRFGDTSGLLAFLDSADPNHPEAVRLWQTARGRRESIVTTNYVVVETVALLHHRFGVRAVRLFCDEVLPAMSVEWISPGIHQVALAALLASSRRGAGLVDLTSFEVMRRIGLTEAIAFDRHFADRGFTATPADPHLPEDQ